MRARTHRCSRVAPLAHGIDGQFVVIATRGGSGPAAAASRSSGSFRNTASTSLCRATLDRYDCAARETQEVTETTTRLPGRATRRSADIACVSGCFASRLRCSFAMFPVGVFDELVHKPQRRPPAQPRFEFAVCRVAENQAAEAIAAMVRRP